MGREEAVWTRADGGRMATNTHIQFSGARRRILRLTARKLALATATAVCATLVLGLLGGVNATPEAARATLPSSSKQHSTFGWPVKPFDKPHPIRGNFGDPRTVFFAPPTPAGLMHGRVDASFHQGIDISAPDGSAVYSVCSGTVVTVTAAWVRVDCGGGNRFEYWHIRSAVKVGDHAETDRTVLGHILREAQHVHLTEYADGRVVNPLAPGRLGPYSDTTAPRVTSIAFRRNDSGTDLLPSFVRGQLQLLVSAEDRPSLPAPGIWKNLPTTPALLTWQIKSWTGKDVTPRHVAFDHRQTEPANSAFWSTYARGTYQNMAVFYPHYSYLQGGCYVFRLTRGPFDTRTLRDGVYDLVVTATDIRGNHSSLTQRFTVHNRSGWIGS